MMNFCQAFISRLDNVSPHKQMCANNTKRKTTTKRIVSKVTPFPKTQGCHPKAIQLKCLMIQSFFLILIYTHTHPHIAFQIMLTKCFFFFFLVNQICSHSPLCYQDELLMCLGAEDKFAKSDSSLPVSKRMPSVR